MEELHNSSHPQHPFKLVEKIDLAATSATFGLCYVCRKPLRTEAKEPIFSCEICQLFLHKRCAEVPSEISQHPLHPQHKLKLVVDVKIRSRRSICYGCNEPCKSFFYHCSDCWYRLHVSCAFPETKLDHPCHEHPLLLLRRRSNFLCDACKSDGYQQSYVCAQCQVWIHLSCALLPGIASRRDHDHPLSVSYCVPNEYRRYKIPCDFCFKDIPFEDWVYYCGLCRYILHFGCLEKYREPRHGIEQPPPDLVRMPTNNFVEIIGHILEKLYRTEITPVAGTMKLGDCGHPLALVTLPDDSERRNTDPACDRCTEPIGGVSPSSCYKCQKCNYFVHSPCAMISSENLLCPLLYDSQSHDLVQVSHQYVWEMLKCKACNLDSNGYFYKCQTLEKLCFDLKCAVLPTKLMHKAHNHHLSVTLGGTNKCSSCGELITSLQYYTCPYCRFHLGYECVTLPESVNHRWDKHTLMLSFPPFSDRPGEFYCEICEEEIHPRRWHYHCKECDQSFHPHCIPKILYRNCKFGGTLEYGKHPHPLEFVREGDYYSKCDSCLELMYGKRVFECSSCRFWICLNCVTKLATSGKVIGPSKICE
ncbi:OLC1v1036937C1 [Oldenlandia corymbosa var. corymbosa]|uniref:OLC1v1036937C1 n=1 Tax=Oldenlandia corymbosa var. corymbosa TaxID=529605 RepID=A0AAV1CWI4_OLDCO|nr:OLC1v1036937C1 [Oldenlandia corymbosa var. corymbosa]